jgi:hypothetical protein
MGLNSGLKGLISSYLFILASNKTDFRKKTRFCLRGLSKKENATHLLGFKSSQR